MLLDSIGSSSPLESTLATLKTRDTDQLKWDAVSPDLTQEWTQLQSISEGYNCKTKDENNTNTVNDNGNNSFNRRFRAHRKGTKLKCDICGGGNHSADNYILNPESPNCKLLDKVKQLSKSLMASAFERGKRKPLITSLV